jgi:hypothetical protein
VISKLEVCFLLHIQFEKKITISLVPATSTLATFHPRASGSGRENEKVGSFWQK